MISKLNFLKNIFLTLALTLLFACIIYYLFPKILYSYFIFPIHKNNQIYLFGDWSVIIAAIKCKLLNYNVFLNNPCDVIGRKHVYGSVLLHIPYFSNFDDFYFIYFPFLINFIFLFVIISHFNLKSFRELLVCAVFVFNPITLLIMERLNFDIFVFLILLFLCKLKKNILNLIFIIFLSLSKFYPLIVSIIFLLNKEKLKKKLFYFFLALFVIFYFLYLDKNNLKIILGNIDQFSADYQWAFNFFALSKIPILLNMFSKNILIVFSILLSFSFFLIGIWFTRINLIVKQISQSDYILCYEEVFFILSASILIFTYFIFNNWIYREVFIFGMIPLCLKNNNQSYLFKSLYNLIFFKLFFFSITSYFSIFYKNDFLLILYQIMNICFISFVFGLIVIFCTFFIKNNILTRSKKII